MKNQSKKILPPKALEVIQKLRLLDDDLMSMVFGENIEATEYLLSVILNRKDLKVLKLSGQREYKNPRVKGRRIRIDVYAKDSDGKIYDIEVQRADNGAGFKRARYHSSMIDVRMLKAGQEFDEIHDSYVIFITENDVIGEGLPLYHIDRTIQETGKNFTDGSHIIYVNGSYRNNEEELGRLMHDFSCENAEDMLNPLLAGHVNYYKETKGGLKKMSKLVEDFAKEWGQEMAQEMAQEIAQKIAQDMAQNMAQDMAQNMAQDMAKETAKETASRLLKRGKLSLEEIAEDSNLPLEVVRELHESLIAVS